jgi:hypothetical protein
VLESRWTQEALRLYRRYQLEIVEACGLCPWAERARVGGTFRERILLQTDVHATEPSVAAIESLIADEGADVAVFVYPRLRLGRLAFERFVTQVRDADAARHPLGGIPFVFAAFHPDALPDTSDAERLIPFLRRTPDPTIQLLRSTLLDRVRSATPQGTQFVDIRALETMSVDAADAPLPLRQRIARANQATVERMGLAEMTRRLDAIVEDRKRAYRALESEPRAPVEVPADD